MSNVVEAARGHQCRPSRLRLRGQEGGGLRARTKNTARANEYTHVGHARWTGSLGLWSGGVSNLVSVISDQLCDGFEESPQRPVYGSALRTKTLTEVT